MDIDNNMEGLTQKLLHATATPLGTMSASSVDDAIMASQHWLHARSGYAIDSADRLLQRLMYERASGAIAVQKRTEAIADLQRKVLQSYLSLGSFRSATERAETILAHMVEWHERGLSTHLPFPEVIALVKVYLYEADCLTNAAKQLLQWTEKSGREPSTELVTLFNAALKLCVRKKDKATALSLCERMEKLEKEHGWQDLVIDADAQKLIVEDFVLAGEAKPDSHDDDSGSRFTPLELRLIHERFTEFLESASEKGRPKALEIAKQMEVLPQSDLRKDVFKALVEYFVRIEDVKQATYLLQRIDIGKGSELFKEVVSPDLFADILQLLAKSQDSDAPWRAQEVVTRMEELENFELMKVATRSYNLLCEAWVNSDELIATQKVEAILSRMLAFKEKGDTSKSPDHETYALYLRLRPKNYNLLTRAVSELMEHRDEMSGKDLANVLESTLEALVAQGQRGTASKLMHSMGRAASKLLRQAVGRGMTVSPTMSINLLEVYRISQQPNAVIRELEFLEGLPDMVLPLTCYEIAIRTLLDAHGLPYEREEALVAQTLERYLTGKLIAESHEMEMMMKRVMMALERQGRAEAVEGMLRTLERVLLSNEASMKDLRVPLECFNNAIKCWADERNVKKMEETLNRLLSYYEAGHESLLPNTSSFFMLIKCQSVEGSSNSNDAAAKAEEILETMCKLYESTGKDVCKPDAHCFNTVLLEWKKVRTLEAVERSTSLLHRMLSLGVEPEIFTFNIVMQIVAYAPDSIANSKFRRISQLMKLMQEAGLEPNRFSSFFMLRACASATKEEERIPALTAAMDSLTRLRQSREADLGTYYVFGKAIRTLLRREPEAKSDKMLAWACLQCYQDGFLDERNKELFQASMSQEAWERVSKSFQRPPTANGSPEQARDGDFISQ